MLNYEREMMKDHMAARESRRSNVARILSDLSTTLARIEADYTARTGRKLHDAI